MCLLGPGGVGKTTLASCVLYDERVVERFERRLLVACEGTSSLNLLMVELANALRIPPEQRDSELYNRILHKISAQPTLICLDNFETPWEGLERRDVESLLVQLASIPNLGLLITVRGTQRPAPSVISWTKPFLPPLRPLPFDDAAALFQDICGQWGRLG